MRDNSGKPALDHRHVGPSAIAFAKRNRPGPCKHDVIGIGLVKDVVISSFFSASVIPRLVVAEGPACERTLKRFISS